MARDFRHGHGQSNKQQFQRKSQAKPVGVQGGKASISMVWAGGFLVSAALLIGFFVTQHFVTVGAKSDQQNENSIFKAAKEVKQPAVESVEIVKEKIQSKPVVVEAVDIKKHEAYKEDNKPQYSFYEGLGKMEVVVDAEPLSVALEQPYYVLAGTFGSEKVARGEKARLAKLGQEVELSVLHRKTKTYYRLRIGPFTDRLVMNKRRNELRRLGVDTLLMKAPRPSQ
jgi:cell division septation protein DedD